jgi:hypothetical protein
MQEFSWPTFIGNFVVSLVVGTGIAFLTVRLTLKRFYSEKWWERKWEAYSGLFDALHHVRNYYDHHWEFTLRGSELPPDTEKALGEKRGTGMAEIRRRIDIGTLVISEHATNVLRTFLADLDAGTRTTDWSVHLDNQLGAVNKCLEALRPIARTELAHR